MSDFYTPVISKRWILERVSQEEIMTKYMKVDVSLKKKYCNPFRPEDKMPGCKFYYKHGVLYFKDYNFDVFSGNLDCISVTQIYYSCSFYEALTHIADDFSLWNKSPVQHVALSTAQADTHSLSSNWLMDIDVKSKNYTAGELELWSVGGIISTQEILHYYNIFSLLAVWFNKQLQQIPREYVFGYKLGDGIWQIYKPKMMYRSKRFRGNDASQIFGLEYCVKGAELIVIAKSRKDAYFLSRLGVNCCYVLNESYIISADDIELLLQYGKRIVLYGDNDEAGINYMNRMKSLHPELSIVHNPMGSPKDPTDFITIYQMEEMMNFLKHNNLLCQ